MPEERPAAGSAVRALFSIVKPGIVASNALTALAGLRLAARFGGSRPAGIEALSVLALAGSSLVVAGSCALNNFFDRDIDKLMERTSRRPIPGGRLAPGAALLFGSALLVSGAVMLAFTTAAACAFALLGAFIYVVVYTLWAKRRTSFSTIIGGLAGAVPPLIGWSALDPGLHRLAWLLFALVLVWQPPHFLALAAKRADEYSLAGLPQPRPEGTRRRILSWILLLFPVPFFMYELGPGFMAAAGLFNAGWLAVGLFGWREAKAWAGRMFVCSLVYLAAVFAAMLAAA